MASCRSLVFTTQEGDSGPRPSCCQDGILVPFSLMTNPAGLSLIISTHKQHMHTHLHAHTHKYRHSQIVLRSPRPLWKKGLKDKMIVSFLKTNFFPLGKKLQCKSYSFFFCIDRNICMLLSVPGNVQKQ